MPARAGAQAGAPGEAAGARAGRALGGGGLTLLGSASGAALGLANAALSARLLGADGYGAFCVGAAFAAIGAALSTCGLTLTALHFLPRYRAERDEARVAGLVRAALALPLALGSALALALWWLAPRLAASGLGVPEAVPFLRAFALAIPLAAASEVAAALTRGFGFAHYYVLTRNAVQPGVQLALLAGLAASGSATPWRVGGCFALASACSLGAGLVCVARAAGPAARASAPRCEVRALLRYAAPLQLNTLFYLVLTWSDVLLLAYFRGGAEVGVYRACIQLVLPFEMILVAFNAPSGHLYSLLDAQGRRGELQQSYALAVRCVTVLAGGAFLALALGGGALLGLFGADFREGVGVLGLLAGAQLLHACFGSAAFVLALCGRQRLESWNCAAAALANVALSLLLVRRLGGIGTAAAALCAFSLLGALRVGQLRAFMGLRTLQPELLRVVLVAAAAAAAAWAASVALGLGAAPAPAALRVAAALCVYLAGIWSFAVSRGDRDALVGLLRPRMGGGR